MLADDLVERFTPWLNAELEGYLRSVATLFAEVETLALDSEDEEDDGWAILFDPDRAPAKALPYLAQFVGERLPRGISEAGAREWIKDAPNQRRGTVRSIFYAAQRTLTGSRLVQVLERTDQNGVANVEHMRVVTFASETPDAAQVLADLRTVVPADVILHYDVLAGQTWANVATKGSWTAVKAAWPTWGQVETALAGTNIYERPR